MNCESVDQPPLLEKASASTNTESAAWAERVSREHRIILCILEKLFFGKSGITIKRPPERDCVGGLAMTHFFEVFSQKEFFKIRCGKMGVSGQILRR